MKIELDSGRVIKLRKNISLDDRDELMDSIEYEWNEDGSIKSVKAMNKTITRWLRICLEGDTSDKELVKWSLEERTDAFIKLQKEMTVGEGKASK